MKKSLSHPDASRSGFSGWRLALLIPAVCLGLAGCASTGGVAGNNPTPVRAGTEVHRGDTKDAVRLALGKPDYTGTHQLRNGVQEAWVYTQTHQGHGGGYYGIPRGWTHGQDGSRYDHDTYYPAPHTGQTHGNTAETDVPVKRVIFENDRVVSYETLHGHGRNS